MEGVRPNYVPGRQAVALIRVASPGIRPVENIPTLVALNQAVPIFLPPPFSSSQIASPTLPIFVPESQPPSDSQWSKPPPSSPPPWAQQLQASSVGLIRSLKILGILLTRIATPGYAIFFDYKRRNDPNFRKQLKKESKRQARAAKEEAEQSTIKQRQAIKETVEMAKEEGFPIDVEE